MRRAMGILPVVLVLMLTLNLIIPVAIYANEISVTINGHQVDFVDQGPVIVDGRTLVPLRGVFEALGFDVSFDNNTRTAILVGSQDSLYSNYELCIPIGSSHFELNGRSFPLDVSAQIINGRTMLPIRPLLERIGLGVDWNYATGTLNIESPIPPTYPLPGMTHEQIMDTLVGTWAVLESDMPEGYRINYFTLNASAPNYLGGDGEVVMGENRQRISWMINVYKDLLISFPDALTYNPILDLSADSVTLFHNAFVEGHVEGFAPYRAVYTRVHKK